MLYYFSNLHLYIYSFPNPFIPCWSKTLSLSRVSQCLHRAENQEAAWPGLKLWSTISRITPGWNRTCLSPDVQGNQHQWEIIGTLSKRRCQCVIHTAYSRIDALPTELLFIRCLLLFFAYEAITAIFHCMLKMSPTEWIFKSCRTDCFPSIFSSVVNLSLSCLLSPFCQMHCRSWLF